MLSALWLKYNYFQIFASPWRFWGKPIWAVAASRIEKRRISTLAPQNIVRLRVQSSQDAIFYCQILNPHFSRAFYCGGGSGHVYCVALRRAPRHTVKYACGALGRAG
jgi:hypothetical protein